MSEHWKSTPKYWCKHCSTYVKDTPFEKKQHEATGKHQGNLRRFLNGIQKDHAKNERERSRTKAEVERLNRVAGASASSTTDSGTGVNFSQAASKATKSSSINLTAADQKRQWAQLAEMGISVPGNTGIDNAVPGGWQTVSQKRVDGPAQDVDEKLNIGVRKRKFESQEEEEVAGDIVVRHGWGSSTKIYPGSAQTADDLDTLLSTAVFKKKRVKELTQEDIKEEEPKGVVEETEQTGEVDLPPSGQALSGTPNSTLAQTLKTETAQSGAESQYETPTPVFKKRRPKHNVSSVIT